MLRSLVTFLTGWILLAGIVSGSLAAESAAVPGERRVALVIGNGAYRDTPILKNPANDGRAMASLLSQLGFEVLSGINLDRAAMEDLIDRFAERVDTADVALAFYAGHGIQVDGRNYLLPVDAKLERRQDVRRLIDAQVLVDETGRAKRLALVMLDACRDNPLARSLQAKERSLGVGRGLAVIQGRLGNTLVAYATAADATAADGEGDNSPYTTALLEHLPTPGLEIGLAFRRVRDSVIKRTGGKQQPFTYGSLGGEELYLVPRPIPIPEPPLSIPSGYNGHDRVAFEVIRDSQRASDFAIFLKNYPNSPLAPFARSRLEDLEAGKGPTPTTVPPAPTEPRATTVSPPVLSSPPPIQAVPSQAQAVEASMRLSRADWTRIQQALTQLGYSTRGTDGQVGANTRRAISQWQKSKNVEVTGYLSSLQRDLILAEAQPRLAALEAARPQPKTPSDAEPAVGVYPEPPPPPPGKTDRAEADDAGEVFKDCAECPEMVTVPAGSFLMGSPVDEVRRVDNEGPQHRVRIGQPFAIGRFEVTFAEWDACAADGGCTAYTPSDEGWGRGSRPVINVSWDDAQAYVAWLSERTGHAYRLPSEAEWEYAARAGSLTPFHVGRTISTEQANYDGTAAYEGGTPGEFRQGTIEVGSLAANAWGLYDMHGNVAEWTIDCLHAGYARAPDDGSAWTTGGDCSERIHRGGSWYADPWHLRSAARQSEATETRDDGIGFRVVRAIAP